MNEEPMTATEVQRRVEEQRKKENEAIARLFDPILDGLVELIKKLTK